MIRKQLKAMRAKHDAFERQKFYYRGLIYRAKIGHNNVIREINRIKKSGTLLLFPLLLKDYDNTLAVIQLKKLRVSKLRSEHNELLRRVRVAEEFLHIPTMGNLWQNAVVPSVQPFIPTVTSLSTD